MPKASELVKKGTEQGKRSAAGFAKSRKARKEEISVPTNTETPSSAQTYGQEPPAPKSKHGGGRPPGTRTAQLTLLMDPALKKILQMDALDRGISAAQIVDEVLRKHYHELSKL